MRCRTPFLRSVACLLIVLGLARPLFGVDPPAQPSADMIEGARRFRAIEEEWDQAWDKYQVALRKTTTRAERKELASRARPDSKPYAERCLRLYADLPDTWGGAAALYWVACNAQDMEAAGGALAQLKDGPIAKADLRLLWGLLFLRTDPRAAPARELAPLVYARAVREPRHPKAADLLIWVCRVSAADGSTAGAGLRDRCPRLESEQGTLADESLRARTDRPFRLL